ncbi:thioredoxin family protein [Sphingobium aromaticiconvertens]|uniref:thioredoxin family protein n=1 Tax=Sphingobium aromaticiconvertens TaxID=365341 RepID=UPI00301AFEC3
MKNIKILGAGCKRCQATEDMIRAEAGKLGVDMTIEKVTDYAAMAQFGVMSTPAVVIDGKVVHAGGLPKQEDIGKWLGA